MYRRLLYLPVILLAASLACNRVPGQLPLSTSAQRPTLVETITPPPPITSPTTTGVPTQLAESLPQATDLAQTAQPPGDVEKGEDQIAPGDIETPLYNLQLGSQVPMANIFHPDLGCNWMGVGGQVFGESGQPVGMLVVELGGSLNGEKVEGLTLTGSANQWGPGGYEFKLNDGPVPTHDQLWLRVLSLDGVPQSERVYFDTYGDCEQAAIVVNFIYHAASIVMLYYFPLIIQNR